MTQIDLAAIDAERGRGKRHQGEVTSRLPCPVFEPVTSPEAG